MTSSESTPAAKVDARLRELADILLGARLSLHPSHYHPNKPLTGSPSAKM